MHDRQYENAIRLIDVNQSVGKNVGKVPPCWCIKNAKKLRRVANVPHQPFHFIIESMA